MNFQCISLSESERFFTLNRWEMEQFITCHIVQWGGILWTRFVLFVETSLVRHLECRTVKLNALIFRCLHNAMTVLWSPDHAVLILEYSIIL